MAPTVEPESSSSNFHLLCQSVTLNLSLSTRNFYAHTSLLILPSTPDLTSFNLHARNLKIRNLTVNHIETSYTLTAPPSLARPTQDVVSSIHAYEREFMHFTLEALDGELSIDLPDGISLQELGDEWQGSRSHFQSLWVDDSGCMFVPKDVGKKDIKYYTPLRIDIDYEGTISDADPGLRRHYQATNKSKDSTTLITTDSRPNPSDTHTPGYYAWLVRQALNPEATTWTPRVDKLSNRSPSGYARYWVPCRDILRERCVWDITVNVEKGTPIPVPSLPGKSQSPNLTSSQSERFVVKSRPNSAVPPLTPLSPSRRKGSPIVFCTGVRLASSPARFAVIEPTAAPNISLAVLFNDAIKARPTYSVQLEESSKTSPSTVEKLREREEQIRNAIVGLGELAAGVLDRDFIRSTTRRIHASPLLCFNVYSPPLSRDPTALNVPHTLKDMLTTMVSAYKINGAVHEVNVAIDPCGLKSAGTGFMVLPSPHVEYLEEEWRWRTLGIELGWEMWTGSLRWIPQTWSEFWITYGMLQLNTYESIRQNFGKNEHLHRLKADMIRLHLMEEHCEHMEMLSEGLMDFDRTVHLDSDVFAPLASSWHPRLDALKLKSGLLLDKLTRGGKSIFALLENSIEIESVRKLHVDTTGCPEIELTCALNRKRMVVEIDVKQESRHRDVRSKPLKGEMVLRVHEPDGYPYEHILGVQAGIQHLEVQYHTKYKRTKKATDHAPRGRKSAAATAAAAAASQDTQMSQVSAPEEDTARRRKKAAEEEVSETIDWIRVDPGLNWLANVHFVLPPAMWVSQLVKDVNVPAQVEAIYSLTDGAEQNQIIHDASHLDSQPSSASRELDEETEGMIELVASSISDERLFWRIRVDAIEIIKHMDKSGGHLLKLMRELRPDGPSVGHRRVAQEPDEKNDDAPYYQYEDDEYHDPDEQTVVDHLLVRGVLESLGYCARYREHRQECVKTIVDFSDANDIMQTVSVIRGLTQACLPILGNSSNPATSGPSHEEILFPQSDEGEEMDPVTEMAVEEIERLRVWDLLNPSDGYMITVECLQGLQVLMEQSIIEKNFALFLAYAASDMPEPIRLQAFWALSVLGGLNSIEGMYRYFLSTIKLDRSLRVRKYVAELLGMQVDLLAPTDEDLMTTWQMLKGAPVRLRHWMIRIGLNVLNSPRSNELLVVLPPAPKLKLKVNEPKATRPKIMLSLKTPLSAKTTASDSQEQDSAPTSERIPSAGPRLIADSRSLFHDVISLDDDLEEGEAPVANGIVDKCRTSSPPKLDALLELNRDSPSHSGEFSCPQSHAQQHVEPSLSAHSNGSHKPTDVFETKKAGLTLSPAPSVKDMSPGRGHVNEHMGSDAHHMANSRIQAADTVETPPPSSDHTDDVVQVIDSESDGQPLDEQRRERWISIASKVLLKLEKSLHSTYFREPVPRDIASYYEIIKSPMDLSTVRMKLTSSNGYTSLRDFVREIRLIFKNCFTFNEIKSIISQQGVKLQAQFEGELMGLIHMSNAWRYITPLPSRRELWRQPVDQPYLLWLLAKLVKLKDAKPFGKPVTGIPQYYDIIDDAMDFAMMKRKAEWYRDQESVAHDFDLIFQNCARFNQKGDPVYEAGARLRLQLLQFWNYDLTTSLPPTIPDSSSAGGKTNNKTPQQANRPAESTTPKPNNLRKRKKSTTLTLPKPKKAKKGSKSAAKAVHYGTPSRSLLTAEPITIDSGSETRDGPSWDTDDVVIVGQTNGIRPAGNIIRLSLGKANLKQ